MHTRHSCKQHACVLTHHFRGPVPKGLRPSSGLRPGAWGTSDNRTSPMALQNGLSDYGFISLRDGFYGSSSPVWSLNRTVTRKSVWKAIQFEPQVHLTPDFMGIPHTYLQQREMRDTYNMSRNINIIPSLPSQKKFLSINCWVIKINVHDCFWFSWRHPFSHYENKMQPHPCLLPFKYIAS